MKVLAMPSERDRHPEEEELERYAMGAGSSEQAAQVEDHLLTCEPCRERLAETDKYLAAMRQAASQLRAGEQAPPSSRILGGLASLLRRARRFSRL